MSTILEMAEAIRSEDVSHTTKDVKPSARSIDADARNFNKDLYELFAARSCVYIADERALLPSHQQIEHC